MQAFFLIPPQFGNCSAVKPGWREELSHQQTTSISDINIMEYILEETVPSEDLKKFEQKYHEELQHGKVINA